MAKSKEQKRKEALARQVESLLRRIRDWCTYMGYENSYKDEVTQSVYESNLVKSAYAAHCDRYGNYLDYPYYKDAPISDYNTKERADPYQYALQCKLYSIEELKEIIDTRSGMSLYKIAYGTLASTRKETKDPYDIHDVGSILNYLIAGDCLLNRKQ